MLRPFPLLVPLRNFCVRSRRWGHFRVTQGQQIPGEVAAGPSEPQTDEERRDALRCLPPPVFSNPSMSLEKRLSDDLESG